jgi:choline dehydrogenase
MNVRRGVRVSAADAYLTDEVRRRPNFEIRPRTKVSRVLLKSRRATGVEVVSGSGLARIRGGEVVLCAGSVSTPGILLRSGIGLPDRVRRAGGVPRVVLQGVGENLSDHAFVGLYALPSAQAGSLEVRSVQTGLRYTAPGSCEDGDLQLFAIVGVDISGSPELAARIGGDRVVTIGAGLQRPCSRGRVRWSPARPQIDLNLCSEPSDLERLRDGLRLAWAFARSEALAPLIREIALVDEAGIESDSAVDQYIREQVVSFKHPTGTAAMGPASGGSAVVDDNCRVHGTDGLRVVDASTMPKIPSANTNLTCLMIGERAADLIRGAERPQPPEATS